MLDPRAVGGPRSRRARGAHASRVARKGARTVISVSGEIDVYTAPSLRERLNELVASGHYDLIVDMEGVEFLDSTGLGVLVGGLKRVRSHDGTLRLVCAQEKILKVFRITGLTKVFPIHADARRGAVADVGGRPTERPADRTGGKAATRHGHRCAALPAGRRARADGPAGRGGGRAPGGARRGPAGRGAARRRGGVCPCRAAVPADGGAAHAVLVEMDDGRPDVRGRRSPTTPAAVDVEDEPIALALVRGLADAVTVADGPGGPAARAYWHRTSGRRPSDRYRERPLTIAASVARSRGPAQRCRARSVSSRSHRRDGLGARCHVP